MSRSSSSSVAPSAAVRTMSPASSGRSRSRIRRRRLRSSSGSRFEMPYVCGWPGTITTKRPGEAHLLREARALVRDRVLRDLHDDRLAVAQHALDAGRLRRLRRRTSSWTTSPRYSTPFFGVPMSMNAASMPGQHVLHAAEVDVAVDRSRVVGRQRDVVLDERAAFEHADVRHAVVALVHDHQVAAGGPALAARAPAALERLLVERLEDRGAVDVDVADRGARVDVRRADCGRSRAAAGAALRSPSPPPLPFAAAALAAAATTPPAPALLRRAFAVASAVSPPRRRGGPAVADLGLRRPRPRCRPASRRCGGRPPFAGRPGPRLRARRRRGRRPSARGRRPRRSSPRPGRRLAAASSSSSSSAAVARRRRRRRRRLRRGPRRHRLRAAPARAGPAPGASRPRPLASRAGAASWARRPRSSRRCPPADSGLVALCGSCDFGAMSVAARLRSSARSGVVFGRRPRSSERSNSDIDAFSHDARASSARGACRHPAVPTACRRARSIDAYAARALRRARRAHRSRARSRRGSRRASHCAVAWSAPSDSVIAHVAIRTRAHIDAPDDRPDVLDDLTALAAPLGRQRRQRRARRSIVRAERRTRRSVCRRRATTSTCHIDRGHRFLQRRRPLDERDRAGDGHAFGQRLGEQRRQRRRGRPRRTNTRSRYSASLSCPVESASPKLTFGSGREPLGERERELA